MEKTDVKDSLKPYVAICETIGETFGDQCEVVLHDLSKPEKSIVYIVNPKITDRKIGESFDYLMNKVLLKEKFKDDTLINYNFVANNGAKIRSSTVFLRDINKKIIGAICINIKIDMFLEMEKILSYFTLNSLDSINKINLDVEDIRCIDDIVDDVIEKIIPENPSQLSKDRKLEIITFLDEKGVFNSKGSIDKVANQLGISKVTVYSYMDELKKNRLDYDKM